MEDLTSRSAAETSSARIEQALKELQEFCAQGRYQEFWDDTIKIEEMFMSLRPALSQNFEPLWLRYCKTCEVAQRKEAALRQQVQANALKIQRELDRLARRYIDRTAQSAATRHGAAYGAYWADAESVEKMFESLPLLEEDRGSLWARYSSLCDEARKGQDQELAESTSNCQMIESMIGEGLIRVEASNDWNALSEARGALQKARQQMRESHLLKEHIDYCWNYWRQANERLFLRQQEFQTAAYATARQDVDQCVEIAAQGDPYMALTGIKDASKNLNRLTLSREQREELRQLLNDAWQKATVRVAQIREERQRRHQEWLQREEQRQLRQQQWRQTMAVKLEEWQGNAKQAEEDISRLQQEIRGLQEEEHQATRAEYAKILKNLIEQKEKEIQRLKQQIAQLQSRIQEVRSKLQG